MSTRSLLSPYLVRETGPLAAQLHASHSSTFSATQTAPYLFHTINDPPHISSFLFPQSHFHHYPQSYKPSYPPPSHVQLHPLSLS